MARPIPRWIARALVALFLIHSTAAAQTVPIWRADRLRSATETLLSQPGEERIALEAPVAPEEYRLVPGDELLLGIWGERPESYRTVVTPDGHLVVPDLVSVDVRGRTLAEGIEAVRAALQSYFPRERIELHLLELGRFRVGLAGAVAKPGYYEVTGAARLSDLIAAAEGTRKEASLRRIRFRGREASLDHTPWYVEGDIEANPLLRPGDLVEVPTWESYVEVGGAIGGPWGLWIEETTPPRVEPNRPDAPERIRVEWMPSDRVATVLALAGGLGVSASGRATLFAADGRVEDLDLQDPEDLSLPVPAFSRLEVEQAARWVYVVGAVRTPGRYPFFPGLAPRDYVLLAGGETENGRTSGWKLILPDGGSRDVDDGVAVQPGATLRVPERRSYWMGRVLAPLTSAAALAISILALTNRN